MPIAGGFDAPIERDCLTFLLRGEQPLLVMPARPLSRFTPPSTWAAAIGSGRLTLESPFAPETRGTPTANAIVRNAALAARASALLVVHATPGGKVERLALSLLRGGSKPVFTPPLPENDTLLAAGAQPLRADALAPLISALDEA